LSGAGATLALRSLTLTLTLALSLALSRTFRSSAAISLPAGGTATRPAGTRRARTTGRTGTRGATRGSPRGPTGGTAAHSGATASATRSGFLTHDFHPHADVRHAVLVHRAREYLADYAAPSALAVGFHRNANRHPDLDGRDITLIHIDLDEHLARVGDFNNLRSFGKGTRGGRHNRAFFKVLLRHHPSAGCGNRGFFKLLLCVLSTHPASNRTRLRALEVGSAQLHVRAVDFRRL
jgi:hypothetical protein